MMKMKRNQHLIVNLTKKLKFLSSLLIIDVMSILKSMINSYYEKKFNTQPINITNNVYVYDNQTRNTINGELINYGVNNIPNEGIGSYRSYNNSQLPSR